jgi:hypothetical protein
MVFKTAERRNNTAERLLQKAAPILTQVRLSTFAEVTETPLAGIWINPADYRDATKGTRFDTEQCRQSWGYRRQTEREQDCRKGNLLLLVQIVKVVRANARYHHLALNENFALSIGGVLR